MLIFPNAIYDGEIDVVQIFPDAHLLPYWRMGIVTSHNGEIGTTSAGPYRLVVAYATCKRAGPFQRVHRIAYLNVADDSRLDGIDPDRESDNLLTPDSFRAGEPLTTEPVRFGLADHGSDGPLKIHWANLIADRKRAADHHCHKLGIAPLQSSVERWGLTYWEPEP
jgi:hypothetical protein